jgi:hypothetical protein
VSKNHAHAAKAIPDQRTLQLLARGDELVPRGGQLRVQRRQRRVLLARQGAQRGELALLGRRTLLRRCQVCGGIRVAAC